MEERKILTFSVKPLVSAMMIEKSWCRADYGLTD